MERKAKNGWMAVVLALAFAATAHGAMIGIGREGAFVLEVFAERSDVARSKGTAVVTLPREAETLFRAAGIRKGDGVWTGTGAPAPGTPWKPSAAVVALSPGWRRCELELKEPVRPEVAAVERFHLASWKTFSARFEARMDALARTNAAACRSGLAEALQTVRTLFGGESMVAGFPGTKYEAAFRNAKRAFDRCVRRGPMRGLSADRGMQSWYREVFGAEWPTALPGIFSAGDGQALEILRITDAEGKDVPDVFERPLPIRLEGNQRAEGAFPAGMRVRIAYAPAGKRGGTAERALPWSFPSSGGTPVWFVLRSAPENGSDLLFSTNLLENAAEIAVSASVGTGEGTRTHALPPGGKAMLCLAMRPGEAPRLNGNPAPPDANAKDWEVSARMVSPGHIRFGAVRKAQPTLVFNNPEMMPVDVTVEPLGGGKRGSRTKLSLQGGETGVGIPVPAHEALSLSYRFRSRFHKPGRREIPGLFCGDSSNVVLRAEWKADPEVSVLNSGSVAVRLHGMQTPAEVTVLPGKTAKVTVPAGKRCVLEGTAEGDWRCEPVSLQAMEPGATASVKLRLVPKGPPQVALRNLRGMMDAEATLADATGRTFGKPVTVKRGETSRPVALPARPGLHFRLAYRRGRVTAEGRLEVPSVPRGETATLDIPDPASGVGVQSKASPVPAR